MLFEGFADVSGSSVFGGDPLIAVCCAPARVINELSVDLGSPGSPLPRPDRCVRRACPPGMALTKVKTYPARDGFSWLVDTKSLMGLLGRSEITERK